MSDINPTPTEREEIEMLLPWYINDTLGQSDRARVAAYLEQHPDMARQVQLVREEQAETIAANQSIVPPPARAFDALMADIANDDRQPRRNFASGLFTQIIDFFNAPSSGGVKWAATAAAVLVLVQAIAITTLVLQNDPSKSYQSASGGTNGATTSGTFALVQFNDAARAAEIAEALNKFGLVIVDGPKPGRLYRIRLDTQKLPEAARDTRISELRNVPEIFSLVTPSN